MITTHYKKTNIEKGFVEYKNGYKYQLYRDVLFMTSLRPEQNIESKYFELGVDGLLWIKAGYCWDGASGLTFDTDTSIRGSLIHDVFYQMMREGLINRCWRKYADELLRDICKIDGMYWWRAGLWYKGVRVGAEKFTDPRYRRKVIIAPDKKQ